MVENQIRFGQLVPLRAGAGSPKRVHTVFGDATIRETAHARVGVADFHHALIEAALRCFANATRGVISSPKCGKNEAESRQLAWA